MLKQEERKCLYTKKKLCSCPFYLKHKNHPFRLLKNSDPIGGENRKKVAKPNCTTTTVSTCQYCSANINSVLYIMYRAYMRGKHKFEQRFSGSGLLAPSNVQIRHSNVDLIRSKCEMSSPSHNL